MKKVRLNLLAAFFIGVVSSCLISCSKARPVVPPLVLNGDITVTLLTNIMTEPSGMTGDQEIFYVWKLNAEEQNINLTTSDSLGNKLDWLKGQSDQLASALKFFEKYDNFSKVKSDISDMLADPEVRYAFTIGPAFASGEVVYASIWICSPRAKKMAYLSAH